MLHRVWSRSVPIVLFVLALSGLPAHRLHAGTIHVTSNQDTDVMGMHGCTLREAMKSAFDEANRNECTGTTDAPNTIVFDGDYTITVSNTLPDAINDVRVDGMGRTVVISGGHTDRIFRLSLDTSDLKVSNVTLKDADSGGGAAAVVEQNGKLTMTNVTISGCHGISNGAAINSNGDVFLTNVNFLNNTADQDGGAIWMGGGTTLTINNGTFTSNTAKGNGGAIYLTNVDSTLANPHPVELTDCVFTLNKAEAAGAEKGGGAIWAKGDDDPEDIFLITSAQFISNSAPNGGGGAILLALNSRLAYATPLLPSAGGIYASNFFDNSSGAQDDKDGMGGAIFNRGIMTIVASSFVNNSSDGASGGAIGHNAGSTNHLTVANVTFSGNEASASGGAIANLHSSGQVDIINSTFSGNKAIAGEGGSVFNDGLLAITNSALTTLGPGENCGGNNPINSGGHNLQFPGDSCGNAVATANPVLGPTTIHPGPNLFVLTMEPAVGSPALGNGDNSTCNLGPIIGLDARALFRPQGDADCDIGAMESANLPPFAALDLAPDGGLSFGFVVSGTTSPAMTASVTNLGNVHIEGMVFNVSPPFFRNGGTCGTLLSPGATCTVDVQLTPVGTGPQDGTLLVQADGGLLDSIQLTGAGVAAAALDLQPQDGIHFGSVLTGTTAGPFTAVLTNIGGVPATNVVVSLSSDFAITGSTCGPTLAAGASCDIPVTFHPATNGVKTSNLSATAAGGLSDQIALTGTGFTPAPGVDLTPNAGLDFGPVLVGDGDVLSATVSQSGVEAVTVTTRSIVGEDFDFQIGPPGPGDCAVPPFVLGVGGHCVIKVTVAPSSNGPRNGTLHVSGARPISDSIPLFAIGHTPGLHLTPDAGLAFGTVTVGADSVPLVATLANTGLSTLSNVQLTIAPSGVFTRVPGGTCPNSNPFTLGPEDTCTARVIFHPVGDVNYGASLRSEASGGFIDPIPLTGSGRLPDPNFDLNPDSGLDFGLVQTFTTGEKLVAKLDNPGAVPVNGVGVSASAGFTITGNTCGSTLPAESGCLLEVTATPGFDGPNTGTLTATAAGGLLDEIGLVVTGFTPSPSLTITPAGGLDFGSLPTIGFANLQATVHNDSDVDLTGLTLTAGAPFAVISGGTCGATLLENSSCTVDVQFTPSEDGQIIGTLTGQADGGLIDAITLSGVGFTIGQTAVFGSSPTAPGPVSFGSSIIHRSVTKDLTLRETGGNEDLILTNPQLGGANPDDFSFPGTAFPMLVKKATSKVLKLTCIPGAATARSGTLVVSTNDPNKPTVTFNLQCTGTPFVDTASPWASAISVLLLGLLGIAALISTRGRRGLASNHGSAGVSSAS